MKSSGQTGLPPATTQALANLSLADLLSSQNLTTNTCEFEENRAEQWFWPEQACQIAGVSGIFPGLFEPRTVRAEPATIMIDPIIIISTTIG